MLTPNRQHGYRGMRLHRSMELMATELMPRVNEAIGAAAQPSHAIAVTRGS